MADIDLNLSDLMILWRDLSRVCQEFGSSDGVGPDLIHAIGDDDLTDRMEDFGDSWDEHREDMTKDLDTVWRGVKIVQEAFTELDRSLSEGLPDAVDLQLVDPPAGGDS